MEKRRLLRRGLLLGYLLSLMSLPLHAQTKTVKVNLSTQQFETALPFDEDFLLTGAVPDKVDRITLRYGGDETLTWPDGVIEEGKEFHFHMEALDPDREYEFVFGLHRADTKLPAPKKYKVLVEGNVDQLPVTGSLTLEEVQEYQASADGQSPQEDDLYARTGTPLSMRSLNEAGDKNAQAARSGDDLEIKVLGKAKSKFEDHFATDIGILRSNKLRLWGLNLNVHWYPFAPINKTQDLRDLGWDPVKNFSKRVSVFGGVVLQEIDSQTAVSVDNVGSLGKLVGGIGVRGFLYWPFSKKYRKALEPFRLNVGVLFFEQTDANPLVSRKRSKRDVFIAVTANYKLKDVLGPLFGALFK